MMVKAVMLSMQDSEKLKGECIISKEERFGVFTAVKIHTMKCCGRTPMFRRSIVPPSSW
jgi:hypothetical protein